MSTDGKNSDERMDDIIRRLKQGDRTALALVGKDNLIPLLTKADGDDNVVKLLREKL